MKISEEHLKAAKDRLKSLSAKPRRSLTAKAFVQGLAPVISEKIAQGYRLDDLWKEVSAQIPEGTKLTEATFRKYWQSAQKEVSGGHAPVMKRKVPENDPTNDNANSGGILTRKPSTDTAADFRNMGGEV